MHDSSVCTRIWASMLVMVMGMITILMFFVSCATIGKCMASDGKSD